jgi:hypothetical protein
MVPINRSTKEGHIINTNGHRRDESDMSFRE